MKKKIILAIPAAMLALGLILTGCPTESSGTTTYYKVTFNLNGGDIDGSTTPIVKEVERGSRVTLPDAPDRAGGYDFWGWYTANGAGGDWGNNFDGSTPITKDITVYARWGTGAKPAEHTVTFNANGGIVSPASITVLQGDTCDPPLPTRSGSYVFSGWNTKQDGTGDVFNSSTPVIANITVYAQWSNVVSGNGSFDGKITGANVHDWDTKTVLASGALYGGSYAYTLLWDEEEDDEELVPLSELIPGTTVEIGANGRLNINLGTPAPSVLRPIEQLLAISPGISATPNTNANIYQLSEFTDKDGDNFLAFFDGKDTWVGFIYADKQLTITGTSKYESEYGYYETTIAYNLRPGWNYAIQTSTEVDKYSYSNISVTGNPGSDCQWFVGDIYTSHTEYIEETYPLPDEGEW
ncbi:MAG: InlB B-repeat-containing protein [Treponema sp.]|nr:InlB B-repeat-containing protein [Treponema sp.]